MNFKYEWSSDDIEKFIKIRSTFSISPTSPASTPNYIYEQILEKVGLSNHASIEDSDKLWNSLVSKYQSLRLTTTLENRNIWIHYSSMHKALNSGSIISQEVQDILAGNALEMQERRDDNSPKHDLVMGETIEEEAARLEEAFRTGKIPLEINGQVYSDEEPELLTDEEDQPDSTLSNADDIFTIEESSLDPLWTIEVTLDFISLRGQKEYNFLKHGNKYTIKGILKELGLINQITVAIARKKWNSLVKKYTVLKKEEGYIKSPNNQIESDQIVDPRQSWPFYDAMDEVMKKIKSIKPETIKQREPEFVWTTEKTRKFIRLRAQKHPEISVKGHYAVYREILEDMGILGKISVEIIRKKWNNLIKRYQEEDSNDHISNWVFMKDMEHIMKNFRCHDAVSKMKSRASPEFLWPNDLTKKFIELRASNYQNFVAIGIQETYLEIMKELGLDHILNPHQLRKKWNYLVAKYREISCSVGPDGSSPAPHSWPFFDDMKKALQLAPENDASKVVKVNYENVWTQDVIINFIRLRGEKASQDTKTISSMFGEIIKELNLNGQITVQQARKKWNYLFTKYLDLSQPGVDEYSRNSWPYYIPMQKAVGNLPISQRISKKSAMDDLDEEGQKQYVCFLCRKSGKSLNDFFMFEQKQTLLHTEKTAIEILSHLLNRKMVCLEAAVSMCTQCTNLINDADSIMKQHNKLKEEAQRLFSIAQSEAKAEKDFISMQRELQEIDYDRLNAENGEIDNIPEDLSQTDSFPHLQEDDDMAESLKLEEKMITYSKRGRKRKLSLPLSSITLRTTIKSEPAVKDEFESCFEDEDEDLAVEEEAPKRRRAPMPRKGRGRGRLKKRGRPSTSKASLIGRGLGGKYPNSNKRKLVSFKGSKIYYCQECPFEFQKYTDLILHKRKVHTVIDTSTLEVEETVLGNGVITYFNKEKANNYDTRHPCRDCDKAFLRKDDLWYHQEIAHTQGKGRVKTAFKDRSYACEECGETFLFKYKLKMHINSKHLNDAGEAADDFVCGECGCKLGSLPGLTFHLRKHHNKALTYRKSAEYLCNHCGYLATSNKKLKEHQEAHCGVSSKPRVNCEICGKSILKVSLKMHRIKMHSDFNEQCDRCGERYATKTDLLRHINVVHLKILLYSCQYCGEKFPSSDTLRYHRVKHHEKPSFVCTICNKSYKRIGELNAHIKRSHNERRRAEVCHHCGKEYYDRSGLRNHLISKHNVPQEMTYSDTYLRKKRINGLPLAKLMEQRGITKENYMNQEGSTEQIDPHSNSSTPPQPHLHPVVHIHHQSQQQAAIPLQPQHHPHQHQQLLLPQQHEQIQIGVRVVDEAVEAARNLGGAYPEGMQREESSLVVTEITENSSQVQQTVLVDPHTHGMVQHHPQLSTHMQPAMPMHHHMHHQVQQQPPPNARYSVLYQMNMQNSAGPSHIM